MSDMDLGEIEGEKLYNPKDVVWVKLSGMWWPAEVQDQAVLDPEITEGLKKPPLCVVQFLLESSYLHIKSLDQIYHYNCKKKIEFLKLGFKKYFKNKNEKNISIWPDVIKEAERRTGGNPDIVNDPEIVPVVEKPEVAMSKPGPSGKRSSLPAGKRRGQGSRHSLPVGHFSGAVQDTKPPIDDGNFRSIQHTRVFLIQRRPPLHDVPQPQRQEYYCERCDLRTLDLERFIIHFKMKHVHIGRSLPPPPPPRPRLAIPGPSKPKKEKKRKEESASPIIKKKKKKSAVKNKESASRPQKKEDPPIALEVSQECEQILKDWDDEDEEMKEGDKTSPSEDMVVDENSTSQAVKDSENSVTPVDKNGPLDDTDESSSKNVETPAPPPKSSSCFDFDDEEPAQPEVQTLKFGQKLPRVISPEKSKSSVADILSDGLELESFLNEVAVPELPSIPSTKHAGSSLKDIKGAKKLLASTARETERKTNDTKELSTSSNQNLEDKKIAASEDGEMKSEEKHFLVEGPLQSKKRKGSGLTEGAEDGSAGKKLKCYGDYEPSKKNDLQKSGDGHTEKVGQLDTVLLEPGTMVLDNLDEALIAVDLSDSTVSESVKMEILTDPNDPKMGCDIPFKGKSTISELDKQSLIDTLTYSPSSVDTDSSQKKTTKKKTKDKSSTPENTLGGKRQELEDGKGDIVSELDEKSTVDSLTHSRTPLDTSTPRKKKFKQDESKKSSKVQRTESSKTPETSNFRSGSRDASSVEVGSPTSRSRSSHSRGSSYSQTKGKRSQVTPSQGSKLVELKSPKSRKSRHSRLDKGNQDLTGKTRPTAGEDGNDPSTSSPTSPKSKRKKIGKSTKSLGKNDKKSSSNQASESKPDASIEKTENLFSDSTKPEDLSVPVVETSCTLEVQQSDSMSDQNKTVIGVENKKLSAGADPTKSSSSKETVQQNVVSSRLISKSGAGNDSSPSLKSSRPSPPGSLIDTKKRDAPLVAESIKEQTSKEKAKSDVNSSDLVKADSDDLSANSLTDSDSTKGGEALQKLSENSKIALEKNEFLEVSKLMPWKQTERPKPSVVEDSDSSTDRQNPQKDEKSKKSSGSRQNDHPLELTEQTTVDDLKKKRSSKSAQEHVHKKKPHDKSLKYVSKPNLLDSTKKGKNKELVKESHKKGEHHSKSSKEKHKPDVKRSKESLLSSDKSPSKTVSLTDGNDTRHSRSRWSSRSDRQVKTLESILSPSRSVPSTPDVAKDLCTASTSRIDKGHSKSKRSSRSSESNESKERISSPSKSTPITPGLAKDEGHSVVRDKGRSRSKRSSHSLNTQIEMPVSSSSPSKRIPKDKGHSEAATPYNDDILSRSKHSSRSHDSQVELQESSLSSKKSIRTSLEDSINEERLSEVATPGGIEDSKHSRSKHSSRSHDKMQETSLSLAPTAAEVGKNEGHSEDATPISGEERGRSRSKRSSRSHNSHMRTRESVSSPSKSTTSDVVKDEVHSETATSTASDGKGHIRRRRSSRSHDSQVKMQESTLSPSKSTTPEVGKHDVLSEAAASTASDSMDRSRSKRSSRSHDIKVKTLESILSPGKSTIPEVAKDEVHPEAESSTASGGMGHSKSKRSSRSHDIQHKTREYISSPSKSTIPEVSKDEVHPEAATSTASGGMGHPKSKCLSHSQDSHVETLESILSPRTSTTTDVVEDEVPPEAATSTDSDSKGDTRSKLSSCSRDCLVGSMSSPSKNISSITEISKDEKSSKAAAPSATNEKELPGTNQLSTSRGSLVETVVPISSPSKGISTAVDSDVVLMTAISNNTEVEILESASTKNENTPDTQEMLSPEGVLVTHSDEMKRPFRSQDSKVETKETVPSPSKDFCATLEVANEDIDSRTEKTRSSSDELESGKHVVISSKTHKNSNQLSSLEGKPDKADDDSSPNRLESGAQADHLGDSLSGATLDDRTLSNEAPLVVASKPISSNEAKQEKKTKEPVDKVGDDSVEEEISMGKSVGPSEAVPVESSKRLSMDQGVKSASAVDTFKESTVNVDDTLLNESKIEAEVEHKMVVPVSDQPEIASSNEASSKTPIDESMSHHMKSPSAAPELVKISDSVFKKDDKDTNKTHTVSYAGEPTFKASDAQENDEGIIISSIDETITGQPASTPRNVVTVDSTCDPESTSDEILNNSSTTLRRKQSPSIVKTEEQTEEIVPTTHLAPEESEIKLVTCKSPNKESTSNQRPISSVEQEETRLAKDVPLSSPTSKSTWKPENEFETSVECPTLKEAPLQSLESSMAMQALVSSDNHKSSLLMDDAHNLVSPSDDGSESKAELTTQVESIVGKLAVLPPCESPAISSPMKSVPTLEENLQKGGCTDGDEPIPSSTQLKSLGLEIELPKQENEKTKDSVFNDKLPSAVPCDTSSSPPEETLIQTKLVSSSVFPEETKLPQVPEKRETKMLELPRAPLVTARASRWDNPFPTQKGDNRPLTPTHKLMASPTKMSLSPVNKVKVEIKSGLVRSFKSPPPDVKFESTGAKPITPGAVQPQTGHQEVTRSAKVETTLPEMTTTTSDFDDEFSALQAEIASYSESKLQAYLSNPDPSDETKKADSLRHKTEKLDQNSRESKTDRIEEMIEKKLENAGPPQVCSKQQIMDLENSLAFDIPLESIPIPLVDCPNQPEVKLKIIPPPTPKVPGLSEAALLASLLKGDDDDLQIQQATNTVSVASSKKEITEPLLPVAKNGQSSTKAAVFDKHNDNNRGLSKSNLLRPVVTSLADVPVVISTIPLPLSEPSISSSQVECSGTHRGNQPAPIVIPVEPPKISPQNQVPNTPSSDDTPTSRVEVLEVERSQPQAGLVGGIDPSKLLDINDIPFVFEEDLIEEGLMPGEPSSMRSPIVTNMDSLNASTLTDSVPSDTTEKTNIVSSTAIDSEETFAIEDLVEEVVEEEPATDSTLSGNVVTEQDFTIEPSTGMRIYEARRVQQFIIDVYDDSDPEFEELFSLPLAEVGMADDQLPVQEPAKKVATSQESQPPKKVATTSQESQPPKKVANVIPIQPKRITSVTTEPKYVSLGSTGKLVSGVSSVGSAPQIIRVQTIKSGKSNKNIISANLERQKVQVATSSSQPEVSRSKEPLKLKMVKDIKTGATKFMVKPHLQLSKSACQKLVLSQQHKNVVKSPASVVASNTLSTKNPSLIQINKSPVLSPNLLPRGTSPSILSQRRSVRQAAPSQRASSIPIQRPVRTKMTSEMLVSSSTVRLPIDHSGLILTNNVLPESSSTNQVLLSGSTNQLVLSNPTNQHAGHKFVSFLVNKPPEPKKPGKDLLEQALTGLDVQNDEAPNVMPTATVVYGMLTDPLQQRPIMTTAVQPSQVILGHDQLLAFEPPDDPSSTVSNSENR